VFSLSKRSFDETKRAYPEDAYRLRRAQILMAIRRMHRNGHLRQLARELETADRNMLYNALTKSLTAKSLGAGGGVLAMMASTGPRRGKKKLAEWEVSLEALERVRNVAANRLAKLPMMLDAIEAAVADIASCTGIQAPAPSLRVRLARAKTGNSVKGETANPRRLKTAGTLSLRRSDMSPVPLQERKTMPAPLGRGATAVRLFREVGRVKTRMGELAHMQDQALALARGEVLTSSEDGGARCDHSPPSGAASSRGHISPSDCSPSTGVTFRSALRDKGRKSPLRQQTRVMIMAD